MKNLTLDNILNIKDQKLKRLDLHDWDGFIWIKSLTTAKYSEVQNANSELQAGLAMAYALCDEKGELLVTEDIYNNAQLLAQRSPGNMEIIFKEILAISVEVKKPKGKKP